MPVPRLSLTVGALFWLGLCVLPRLALSQMPAPVSTPAVVGASAPRPAASTPRPGVARPSASKSVAVKALTKPLWTELTPAQQQSLGPLAPPRWDTLSEARKRKWLALSANFPKMSGAEQAKLHSRMNEWASLSTQQRIQARLSFGETQQIPADDKKAKWEAYQALPAEEKRKLAAGATKSPATAAAVKPVAPEKLAVVPKPRPKPRPEPMTPRVAAAPNQVDHNPLSPQQGPAPNPAPN